MAWNTGPRMRLHRNPVLRPQHRKIQRRHDRDHRGAGGLVAADLQPVPVRADMVGGVDHPGRQPEQFPLDPAQHVELRRAVSALAARYVSWAHSFLSLPYGRRRSKGQRRLPARRAAKASLGFQPGRRGLGVASLRQRATPPKGDVDAEPLLPSRLGLAAAAVSPAGQPADTTTARADTRQREHVRAGVPHQAAPHRGDPGQPALFRQGRHHR